MLPLMLIWVLISDPVQACREAEIEPGKGLCCLSNSEFHSPPARLSIAGNPKGKHAGALSFGYFSLSKQSKSNSPIKGEKQGSIQATE